MKHINFLVIMKRLIQNLIKFKKNNTIIEIFNFSVPNLVMKDKS